MFGFARSRHTSKLEISSETSKTVEGRQRGSFRSRLHVPRYNSNRRIRLTRCSGENESIRLVAQPCTVMSCLTALDSQIVTLLSVPHEILFLQHKVFREYAKIAVGPDFIHTLPSLLILVSMAIVLWRCPPSYNGLAQITGSVMYKSLQLLVSWVVVIAILWFWLMWQRLIYCCVWTSWSYQSEYRDVSYQWWQQVWSSYYPPPLEPPVMSAGFISWLISMSIAVTVLGCAVSTNRVWNFATELAIGMKDAVSTVKFYANSYLKRRISHMVHQLWLQGEPIAIASKKSNVPNDSEASSICDECRSEISTDAMINDHRREILPVSYGTNWMPKPNFSGYKEPIKKVSMKSLHTVAVVNDIQDSDDLSPRHSRYKRGCHTVIPNNSSDQSSGC
ncbi:uncharacterized protein LOC107998924 [Apis cerana]|uniref:uncharacterized protein LOC107998924 n=1 Tax=Apis cerana TaxID=7461 RepID=UPI002B2373C6|nr:uncharacterized protein LOC107998924 [Apis cerana]